MQPLNGRARKNQIQMIRQAVNALDVPANKGEAPVWILPENTKTLLKIQQCSLTKSSMEEAAFGAVFRCPRIRE